MDHRPDCVQGFGCHCLVNETAPIVGLSTTRQSMNLSGLPRWLALIAWLVRWP